MFKKLFVVLIVCFFSAPALAADLSFTWTENANIEGKDTNGVTGYRIYRDPSTAIQFVFPDIVQAEACDDTGKCIATVPDIADGKNHRYVATAYNDSGESDFSQYADVIVEAPKTPVDPIDQAPDTPEKIIRYLLTLEKVTN